MSAPERRVVGPTTHWNILDDPIEVYVDDVRVSVLAMGHLNGGPDKGTLVVHCTSANGSSSVGVPSESTVEEPTHDGRSS